LVFEPSITVATPVASVAGCSPLDLPSFLGELLGDVGDGALGTLAGRLMQEPVLLANAAATLP